MSTTEHEKLEQIIHTDSTDYVTDLIEQIKKLSFYFKKISLIDQQYFKNQSDEYNQLHKRVEAKLTNLIKNFLSLTSKDVELSDYFTLNNFDEIVNSVEDYFEKIAENIDILRGIKKERKDEDIKNELKSLQQTKLNQRAKVFNVKNNTEDFFDIDNSYYPFIPKISKKENCVTPLDERINDARKLRNENKDKFLLKFEDSKNKDIQQAQFTNPYTPEISKFNKEYISHLSELSNKFKKTKQKKFNFIDIKDNNIEKVNDDFTLYIQHYPPANATPLSFIQSKEDLQVLYDKLKQVKEIAIDLEHHQIESYLGITCLIQISTRTEDFIIDALKLRNELHILNSLFTDPSIVKVLHGSDYDIEWLQKDFGLYVVNMFDTGQASRLLRYSSFALKYLLKRICNFDADKKYQLADWRIRPLPQEMINYARSDTHYLLYIYDVLRKELIEKAMEDESKGGVFGLLSECIKHSSEICMKSYQKPKVKANEYYHFIAINSGKKHRELGVLKEIFIFRDYIARKLDISGDRVLSKSKMVKLAKIKEFNFDNVIQVIEGSTPLLKFMNEFIEVINKKIERIEKKEKSKVDLSEQKEREYCEKIKEMLKRDEMKEKQQKANNIIQMINFDKNQKIFDEIEDSITINSITSINPLKSKFISLNETKMQTYPKVNEVKNTLNNFNLISFLKNKHNITKVTIKKSDVSRNQMKNEINKKREHEEEERKKQREEEEKLKKKFSKFTDVTDNNKIFEELKKKEKEDYESSSSEEDDEIIMDKEAKKKIDPSLELKEKFLKNFVQTQRNKTYENKKVYASKKKKK